MTVPNQNTSGNTWVIDDPKATATGAAVKLSIGTSTTSNGSTTLTTTNGVFTAFDVGRLVTGSGIPAGTTLTGSVGQQRHAVGFGQRHGDLVGDGHRPERERRLLDGLDGIWTPNITSALQDPRGPVAEAQHLAEQRQPDVRRHPLRVPRARHRQPELRADPDPRRLHNSVGGTITSIICTVPRGRRSAASASPSSTPLIRAVPLVCRAQHHGLELPGVRPVVAPSLSPGRAPRRGPAGAGRREPARAPGVVLLSFLLKKW